MINRLKKHWEILIILLLGLTPLLWYKNSNSLALGHDMGFPINPVNFFSDRLFLWTDRVGLGWDQTLASAAILIHGLEASLAGLGLSVFVVQKIVFIFWMVLPGLAMYYFVSRIHKEKEEWFLRLSASFFYMFNHFLLQGWFIAERTKFSLYAALPLLLTLIMQMIKGEIRIIKGLCFISIIFFFLNGGGGIPLFGGLLLTIGLAFMYFGFLEIRKNHKKGIKRLSLIALGVFFSFIFANFYWILPTFIKMFRSYGESLSSIGGISSVLDWSFEVSRFASIQNVIRLQGIPDWYDNTLHPYSELFLNNPILIFVSVIIPSVVFSSLLLIKRVPQYKNNIIYFNILAILGIIFTAGSHPPFGFLYDLFLSYIPGFAIFRSGFYKFAPALWFAYAYLFSFSVYFIIQKINLLKDKKWKNLIFITILVCILGYSFPFFTGSFFNWKKPLSTMTKLPNYVIDFGKWSNSTLTFNDRVLSFPEENRGWNASTYDWGYWSTAPVESLFTDKSIIVNDKVMSPAEKKIIEKIYASIINENDDWRTPLRLLGINFFVLHNDFLFNAPRMQTIKPDEFKNKFLKLGLSAEKSFGKWEIFKTGELGRRFFIDSNPDLIIGSQEILNDQYIEIDSVLKIPAISNFYFTDDSSWQEKSFFFRNIQIERCLFCDKENRQFSLYPPEPKILPGSLFYPIVERREKNQRKVFSDNIHSKIDFSLGTSLKRIGEIKSLVSKKENENKIEKTINQLSQEIDYLSESMNEIDKNSNSSQLLILRVNNFLEEEHRLIDEVAEQGNKSVNRMMTQVSEKISDVYQSNEKYQYDYPLENEKIYFFNLNSDGDFELLIRNQEGNDSISKLIIDNIEIDFRPEKKDGYISVGNFNLKKGEHEIKFMLNEPTNMINLNKNYSVKGCHNFKFEKVLPDKIYKLGFNFKGKNFIVESRSFIKIEQFTTEGVLTNRLKFGENASSNRFETKITTTNQAYAMNLSICTPSGDANDISIGNPSFKIFQNPTALLIKNKNNNFMDPVMTAGMKNKTNYQVSIEKAENPYLFVMNNAYNPNWEITSKGKKLNAEHIKINGFANGWIIDEKGNYSINVLYKPQKYFYVGVLLTGVYMLIVFLYILKNKK
ncbi:hypothetical protein HZA75_06330 [Candidatus Roizmanbacteria bacterium]|nr:hypothetical protein [Candidatus Roizmanbacteria bacterium]